MDKYSSEKLIAEELSKLTIQEREKAYEDVHGVSNLVEESPELIERCLLELKRELDLNKNSFAYDLAKRLSEKYVSNRKLRLQFLRATLFDPKKAALRMVRFFDLKLELFGTENLAKTITFEDLGENSMNALRQGPIQVLPSRDNQGRAVIVSNQNSFLSLVDKYERPVITLGRVLWYVIACAADDEETQKRGIVIISYAVGSQQRPDAIRRQLLGQCAMMADAVLARVSAVHYCFRASSSAAALWRAIVGGGGTVLRVRMRTHSGSHSECQYSLATFGINIADFPVDMNGMLKLANHTKWLERRQIKENCLNLNIVKDGAVDLPSRFDVLLGRGKPFNSHPGNKRLHEIIGNFFIEYNQLFRSQKTKLAADIVQMVHEYGGRFLKQDEESAMWVEVSDLEARNKVAHGFRRKRESEINVGSNVGKSSVVWVEVDKESKKRMKVDTTAVSASSTSMSRGCFCGEG
eukprot:scaffold6883_cov113-Cylindrotheca_fusiformis.AAC.1